MPKVTLVDNYDSFTWNLVHDSARSGPRWTCIATTRLPSTKSPRKKPDAIVISPGPGTPDDSGISLEVVRRLGDTTPIFGVCLGNQTIGQVYGGKVVRGPEPVHGKLSKIRHSGEGVMRGINGEFQATRYHSLVVARDSVPADLAVTAETDGGIVMGLSHKKLPGVHGVQFHPESIASEHGQTVLKNFLDLAANWTHRK